MERFDARFKVVNDRIESFSKGGLKVEEGKGIWWIILLSLYLLVANMILPVLPFTKEWYDNVDMFP